MKVAPLFDRVLVKPISEQVSGGGIFVPQSSSERSIAMTIVARGESAPEIFSVGSQVIVSKYAGVEVVIDNEKHFVMPSADILAKIEN